MVLVVNMTVAFGEIGGWWGENTEWEGGFYGTHNFLLFSFTKKSHSCSGDAELDNDTATIE